MMIKYMGIQTRWYLMIQDWGKTDGLYQEFGLTDDFGSAKNQIQLI